MRRLRPAVALAILAILATAPQRAPAEDRDPWLPTLPMAPPDRREELAALLDEGAVTGEARARALADFVALRADGQEAVLALMSDRYALASGYPAIARHRLRVGVTPAGDGAIPTRGSADRFSALVCGAACPTPLARVLWDARELPVFSHAVFAGHLLFRVPADASRGEHVVTVRDGEARRCGTPRSYRVVSPIGWRGVHGWSFPNFAETRLGWAAMRDTFGAAAVDFSPTARRPSAQAWYDAAWSHAATAGTALGMVVRAERVRRDRPAPPHAAYWAGRPHATVWDYPQTQPEVVASIQIDQAAFVSREGLAFLARGTGQSADAAWDLARGALLSRRPERQPVLVLGSSLGAHAVLAFRAEESANERRLHVYDPNRPYAEDEAGAGPPALLGRGAGPATVRYERYSDVRVIPFDELPLSTVHLPTEPGDPLDGVVLAVRPAGAVRAARDGEGRALRGVVLPGGALAAPDVPLLFVVPHARGRAVRVELDGDTATVVDAFWAGRAVSVAGHHAEISLTELLTAKARLATRAGPGPAGTRSATVIAVDARGERVVRLAPTDARGARGEASFTVQREDGAVTVEHSGSPLGAFDYDARALGPDGRLVRHVRIRVLPSRLVRGSEAPRQAPTP